MRNLILTGLLALSPLALHAQTIAISDQQQQMLGVKTETLQGTDTSWSASHPASVQVPNDQLRVVSTPVPGILERLEVAEGASVKAGDVLAVIMSPTLLDQQRNYLDALTNLSFASAEMKRDRDLDKEGIISKRRFLETQSKYIRAKTDAEQARQLLELAGLDKSELVALASKRQLSGKLKIRSPLNGVVLEQMAVPGQRLEALDSIYRVGHLNPLWLEIHAPLDEVSEISVGDLIQVKEPYITGRVITIGRMVHGEDQGVMVRAEITEKTDLLRPGQFVQVSLASTGETQQFRIPRSAMIRQDGKTWIFIKTKDGFEPREAVVVTEEQSDLIVRGEIRAGEQLAVSGTSALKAAWQEGKE
jgi:cobalt-zinc-cadmium efflux system membrane fusion protein